MNLKKTVFPEPSQKIVLLKNVASKQPKVEYCFWINVRALTFSIFPKESRKDQSKILTFEKLITKLKSHAKVLTSNSNPRNSKTH